MEKGRKILDKNKDWVAPFAVEGRGGEKVKRVVHLWELEGSFRHLQQRLYIVQ